MDGLRIITVQDNKIIRSIDENYLSIFEEITITAAPGQRLYDSYVAFERMSPLPDEDIKTKKDDLLTAINQCTEAAKYELD